MGAAGRRLRLSPGQAVLPRAAAAATVFRRGRAQGRRGSRRQKLRLKVKEN